MRSVVCQILSKQYHFRLPKIFDILFGEYLELRKSTWASQCTYNMLLKFHNPKFEVLTLKYSRDIDYFCSEFVKIYSKTAQSCMASLLATVYMMEGRTKN